MRYKNYLLLPYHMVSEVEVLFLFLMLFARAIKIEFYDMR